MKPICIYGNQGSGKTVLANKLAGDKPFVCSGVPNTKYLDFEPSAIIIELQWNEGMEKVKCLIEQKTLHFRSTYAGCETAITMPQLIFTAYKKKVFKGLKNVQLIKTKKL